MKNMMYLEEYKKPLLYSSSNLDMFNINIEICIRFPATYTEYTDKMFEENHVDTKISLYLDQVMNLFSFVKLTG